LRALILGGTRFLGRRVARLLVERGAQVTLVHRGVSGEAASGATSVIGDRSAADGGLGGLGSRSFDAVLDLSGYFSAWTASAVAALSGRVAHYAFVSSGAVYPSVAELPVPESTPFGPNPIWGPYGLEKVASERLLWHAYEEGRFAVSVYRFPYVLGPANFVDRESFVFSRLEHGRPILLPAGGRTIKQFVYVDDVAEALVAALERPDVVAGEAYNCAYARGITNRGWVELCGSVAGIEPNVVAVDADALGVASDSVDLNDLVFPYPEEHYLLDGGKLERELGVRMTTGNRRMLEEFASWWETQPPEKRRPRSYDREDRALAALARGRAGDG
jgi:nucleoside-diphosphate-sugar epimerase